MGQITSLFVRKVIGEVDAAVDKAALLRSLGIEYGGPVDPARMIPAAKYYDLLEKLASVDRNGITLPLRVGAAMSCDDYSAFGLAWKSAPTLLESYERAERYARVLTSVSTYRVEKVSQGAFMHLHRAGERRLGMRLSNEATIASVASISREVSSVGFSPLEVHFQHPAPDSVCEHEAYFSCPVFFGSDRDALLVGAKVLLAPNKLGDKGISNFFDSHLGTELSSLDQVPSFEQELRDFVSRVLSGGIPAITDVAGHFHMTGRTLPRRLAKSGVSYQSLVDDSRRLLAERLLGQTEYTLAEVAFMTGFSEQSSFTRAFKRWAGQTPRSYRIQTQSRVR